MTINLTRRQVLVAGMVNMFMIGCGNDSSYDDPTLTPTPTVTPTVTCSGLITVSGCRGY